jgi:Rieske Fe-S protein
MSEQNGPKWRTDFPITWGADNYVTRKEFTRFLVLVSGATLAGNGYILARRNREVAQEHKSVAIAHVDELAAGAVKLFQYPTADDPAMLIRLFNGDYVAYKQRCTHLSCPVHFIREHNRLECPCHNGVFDAATGEVLEGPPPRPLPHIALRIADGVIYAEGVIGS